MRIESIRIFSATTAWHRRRPRGRARAGLIWSLVFFIGLQLVLAAWTNSFQPELRDPEYGYKLTRLRARISQGKNRPLVLVLGSSRAGLGICPELLSKLASGGEAPLVFNFALTGSGPIMELLCLRRLLTSGIHPNEVIIEVMPPLLYQEGSWAEEKWLSVNRLAIADMLLVRRYSQHAGSLIYKWIRSALPPCFSNRFCIMSHFAPGWLSWDVRQDGWSALDGFGWLPYRYETVDGPEYCRGLEHACKQYYAVLQGYHLSPLPDQALHELLDLCRQEQISAMLLIMPEGSEFRSWYPERARADIAGYLARLREEYNVPMIDARSWMADSAFFDSHHLLPRGATDFTQRLAQRWSLQWVKDNHENSASLR